MNYDKLLYESFINNDIFEGGYGAYLIDGMLDSGFHEDSLERKFGRNFGYYLHLHGSPLFIDQNNLIVKLRRDQLASYSQGIGHHIVLCHIDHKPSVIDSSYVLKTYWDYLKFTLSEADEVILFGYSGLDKHLNMMIKPYLKSRKCRVIEWSGTDGDRDAFWKTELDIQPTLIHLDNILNYTGW